MVTIHKPNSVQITVDSLMAHYDRAKRKQEQAASQRPERAQRRAGGREGREGGEAREERRRQKLAALYQATLTEAEGLAEPLSMWQRFSLDEVAELARRWLPLLCGRSADDPTAAGGDLPFATQAMAAASSGILSAPSNTL